MIRILFIFLFITHSLSAQETTNNKSITKGFVEVNGGPSFFSNYTNAKTAGGALCLHNKLVFFELRFSYNWEEEISRFFKVQYNNSISAGPGVYFIKRKVNLIGKAGFGFVSSYGRSYYFSEKNHITYFNVPVALTFQVPGKSFGMGLSVFTHLNAENPGAGITLDFLFGASKKQ
jgi:hypothetical protein